MKTSLNNILSIMTWDIYLGTDFFKLSNTTLEELPNAVTECYRQVLATNFKERSKALAYEINDKKPDIIGLQSVAVWTLSNPNSKKVVYDFLSILLKELKSLGLNYEICAFNNNFNRELLSSEGNIITVLDRDIILVNKNTNIKIINRKESNFNRNLQLLIGAEIATILRGYSYIDVIFNRVVFRIINTHLESYSNEVNITQGNELIVGPANTNLPMIIIGNFNSDASAGADTFENLIISGFQDTWFSGGKGCGYTCCQSDDLLDPYSNLNKREDLILIKNYNNFSVIKDKVVGNELCSRTKSNLWPSTHGGIISAIEIRRY